MPSSFPTQLSNLHLSLASRCITIEPPGKPRDRLCIPSNSPTDINTVWWFFRMFTEFCSHHHVVVLEHFITLKRNRSHSSILPLLHLHHPQPCVLSCFRLVRLFATLWTIAHQAPLSVGFSRQEYWSGLLCPNPGDLPDPGIEPKSLMSPALAGRLVATNATWEASHFSLNSTYK